jgi:type II secretory pathway component PulM
MNLERYLERYLERIDPRQLRLLLAGGLLLLAALFFSLLWPQVKNYRALRHSQGILQQASTNQVELAQQQTTLRAGIAQLRHGLHGDMVDLPLKQVETRVIGLLQRLCERHHLELASVIPRPIWSW